MCEHTGAIMLTNLIWDIDIQCKGNNTQDIVYRPQDEPDHDNSNLGAVNLLCHTSWG